MRAQAGRALVQAGHKSKQFEVVFSQKKPSSELCLKISYRWLLDFCWFFVCTKVSQLLLLFEVVIRSKREYKVVHCVNLTIFFFWWWLKTFWFFSNCRLIVIGGDGGVWRRRIVAAIDCFFGKCFFFSYFALYKSSLNCWGGIVFFLIADNL